MNVSIAEFAIVTGALLLFAVVPAILSAIAATRRVPVASAYSAPATLAPYPADTAENAYPSTPFDGSAPPFPDAPIAEPLPPVTLRPPQPWPATARPAQAFRLHELRIAGDEVVPVESVGLDRSNGAHALIHGLRRELERVSLAAPTDANAYVFAGIERAGDEARIVALLFADLWPASEANAVARALFHLRADGSVDSVAVEPTH